MAFNPGTEYRGDQYLARGIESFGKSIADAVEKRAEQRQKALDNAKVADLFFKTNPEALQTMGIDELAYKGQSAEERARTGLAAITAYGEQRKRKEMEIAERNAKAMEQYHGAVTAEINQKAIDKANLERDVAGFYRELNGPTATQVDMGTPTGNPKFDMPGLTESVVNSYPGAGSSKVDPGMLARALAKYPRAMSPENFAQVSEYLQRYSDKAGVGGMPEMQDINGYPTMFNRHTGTFQVLPDQNAMGQVVDLVDENGNPTGRQGMKTGKGIVTLGSVRVPKVNSELLKGMEEAHDNIVSLSRALKDPKLKLDDKTKKEASLKNWQDKIQRKIDYYADYGSVTPEQRDMLYERYGLSPASEPATAGMATVSNEKEYQAIQPGTRYRAAWDGKIYIKK